MILPTHWHTNITPSSVTRVLTFDQQWRATLRLPSCVFSFAAVAKQLLFSVKLSEHGPAGVEFRDAKRRGVRGWWFGMVNVPPDLRAPDAPSVLRKEKQATALLPISTRRPRTLISPGVIDSDSETFEKPIIYARWRLSKVIESGRDCASISATMETKVELEDPGRRSRLHSSTARGAGQAVRL
jgi:hypothetical protein